MGSCSGTVPEFETGSVEPVDGLGGSGEWHCDTLESLLDIGMEAEEQEGEPLEDRDEEDNGISEPVMYSIVEILEMEFNNPDEASGFYQQYIRAKGFAMRQGKKLKNKKGEIVWYTYLCNREGFRDKKWLEMQDQKREHKVVRRCRCLAEMRIKPKSDSGIWYVSRFVDDHNHDVLPANFVPYLPSYRKISDVNLAYMDSLRQVGISIPKIYESIAAQAGGFNLVPFTKRDMYNEIRRQRALRNGDVNAPLRFFERCARGDEKMFWSCMLADIEVEEFEKQWEVMVEECRVREVEWVKVLYKKKLSWTTAYIRGCFFAGLRTTSRCELSHAKLGRFVESRYGILEFVTNFQRCVDFLRDNEEELDF
ncbi:hypothetical protein Ahy_A04g018624 [Arachis hypogaea]|uniref:FAR1 domain-containing protein n=1 Tax=Arachis hypogaea TaxID=3818 RepID=A0A445DE86_ARAHY|nr:hypothetical protein Ahy_A04g018624 [Arachis hypogaea]